VDEVPLAELAAAHGTPLYVYSESHMDLLRGGGEFFAGDSEQWRVSMLCPVGQGGAGGEQWGIR
jgi:hypothetical protein